MTRVAKPPSSTRAIERRPEALDLRDLAARVALVFLEIEAGRRPLTQIRPLSSPALYRRLVRSRKARSPLEGRGHGPTAKSVKSVFCQQLGSDAVEASVVIDRGIRVTALALRLERHRGSWRVVELTAPENGEPPRRTASVPAAASVSEHS